MHFTAYAAAGLLALSPAVLAADKPCKNKVNSWDSTKLKFPTVASIKADMKKCGNMDGSVPSIFYSFGGTARQAAQFRDTFPANARPNTFYDTLPAEWELAVDKQVRKTLAAGLTQGSVQYVLNARKSQAMAELSPDSFMMTGPGTDINTVPNAPKNVWREQEMPALILLGRTITRVENAAPWTTEVQQPSQRYPLQSADQIPIPGWPANAGEDDGAACCMCVVQRNLNGKTTSTPVKSDSKPCDSTCCQKASISSSTASSTATSSSGRSSATKSASSSTKVVPTTMVTSTKSGTGKPSFTTRPSIKATKTNPAKPTKTRATKPTKGTTKGAGKGKGKGKKGSK